MVCPLLEERYESQLPMTDVFIVWFPVSVLNRQCATCSVTPVPEHEVTQVTIQPDLGYELDDLDKNVEGRVPGHHTARAFGEKC